MREFPNKGALSTHLRFGCKGPPKKIEPEVVTFLGRMPHGKLENLDEVCAALEDGLNLEDACSLHLADVRAYYAAIRRETTNDPSLLPEEKAAARRVKQAQAKHMHGLMTILKNPGNAKNVVPAAKALVEVMQQRIKLKNLRVQYNGRLLLDVCRKHVTDDQFRAILTDLCEVDPEMATADMDRRVFGEGTLT